MLTASSYWEESHACDTLLFWYFKVSMSVYTCSIKRSLISMLRCNSTNFLLLCCNSSTPPVALQLFFFSFKCLSYSFFHFVFHHASKCFSLLLFSAPYREQSLLWAFKAHWDIVLILTSYWYWVLQMHMTWHDIE